MLNTNTGKGSVFSIGELLKFLLILSVSGDLFSETDLSSHNRTESDFVNNKTTKPPILSIDEHSENVEEKKSSMVNRFLFEEECDNWFDAFIQQKRLDRSRNTESEYILSCSSSADYFRKRLQSTQSKTDKGDFFTNMFPILSFATLGTVISALTIGSALYILGQADLIYKMSAAESFAFGSMISAVDPVATLAIFQALNVERMLYMLVFGESMLNDAVSIVLTSASLEMSLQSVSPSTLDSLFFPVISRFTYIFFISALLGAFVGFLSALLFKYVDLRKTPSLEFALLLIFAYLPYGLAEAISLSGIMAILFCSITMSQYTHFNISPITQITMQQTFRTLAFVAETCTFAYLGLALFTIKLQFQPMFVSWSIESQVTVNFLNYQLICNPSALKVSSGRYITERLKIYVTSFKGMRGAVAFALALHISIENEETKRVLLTTTLFIVLFTIIFLGGTTLPMLRMLSNVFPDRKHRKSVGIRIASDGDKSAVLLSKTQEMFIFDQSEHLSSDTEEIDNYRKHERDTYKGAAYKFNELFVRPFFVRRYTLQEQQENRMNMHRITSKILSADSDGLTRRFSTDEASISSSSIAQPLL
ncbi:unnamed protein product [Acanthocheilonema viteae]|uniref:Sodium/hydrogen exchanger n=1 Tax=Acanthocheilonema viteae TaxID=6277 RepID=A0A498RYI9_ACAVI|nr:unnamed protein product [Acanthocheilonema viteae]